ncbi:S24 family peptidase [Sphingomicrobium nitratireducens]|uniref:S24 family peptidase n=1 Tax=Sphingomicrobium nitratireducens TaxID=2964666 RepID=UPI00223F7AF3|nr:LexA family transcriptional regulator [Sphingomicrobium nitratireducens]
MTESPAQLIERLCRERGADYAGLSRLIGKNSAYIHQFIHRGSPKRLGEEERRTLARYFGVSEEMLGGPAVGALEADGLAVVARRPVRASAGPGALAAGERAHGRFGFDPAWLRRLTASRPDQLAVIRVEGDSMAPTLAEGDDILIDHGDAAGRLRDGIYVLRIDDALVVKRLALHPFDGRITIQSDNPAWPDWPDVPRGDLDIVGRVLWAGRRIS